MTDHHFTENSINHFIKWKKKLQQQQMKYGLKPLDTFHYAFMVDLSVKCIPSAPMKLIHVCRDLSDQYSYLFDMLHF